jgi:cell division protein FtsB
LSEPSRIERRRAATRRRVRVLTVACAGFCLLVLVTSFPAAALLRQHHALSTASSELNSLNASNRTLSREADELAQPQNVATVAQKDYGMIRPGQTAYKVIATGSQHKAAPSTGSGTLDQPPVVPGTSGSAIARSSARSGPPSFWNRVLSTLEFWH